jgi:hypothetical protein
VTKSVSIVLDENILLEEKSGLDRHMKVLVDCITGTRLELYIACYPLR